PTLTPHQGAPMQLIALGLDYRQADLALRERLAIPASDLPAALARLREHAAEGALLATCNRTELYLIADTAAAGHAAGLHCLADLASLPVDELAPLIVAYRQEEAVRHLCRVAAGLESMVLGEHEILGQVRAALEAAEAAGTAGVAMRRLFQQALAVGGRVRAETGIARQALSTSTVGVRLAERALGGLAGRTALVIGTGKMCVAAARALVDADVALLVVGRRSERAHALADALGGEGLGLDRLVDGLARADLVISATSAPDLVVRESDVRAALARRPARRLVLVDLAVPRDVDSTVGSLPSCTLYDVDDLAAAREAGLAARQLEAPKVEAAIEDAVARFATWWGGRAVAPVVAELVVHAERIRRAEVERVLGRLGPLTERERAVAEAAVEATTTALVGKLLHEPIVRLKRRGGQHDAAVYAHAVRELFALAHPTADKEPTPDGETAP
ncbi:MAG: glutamyl-tRNA reductase, partial [Chloroflexota bacterium]|nr:glutamyl-tRNA reductase [Chloroflexota bacterium]